MLAGAWGPQGHSILSVPRVAGLASGAEVGAKQNVVRGVEFALPCLWRP